MTTTDEALRAAQDALRAAQNARHGTTKTTTTREEPLDHLTDISMRHVFLFTNALAIGAGLQLGKRLAGGGRK